MLQRILITGFGLFLSYTAQSEPLNILVTIPPQAFLVKYIASNNHNITVLIDQNQNPHNFELTPKKLKTISNTDIYFTIMLPLEKAIVPKLKNVKPNLTVINVPIRNTLDDNHEEEPHDGHNHEEDAHYWMDPLFMRDHAKDIAYYLCIYDPLNTITYLSNYLSLQFKLYSLNTTLTQQFQALQQKSIFVYHPALGHFCSRFGLTQISIEANGKEPGPKKLAELIAYAQQQGFNTIFSQKQYPTKAVNIIAQSLNAEIQLIEPLEEAYISNLINISQIILHNGATP